MQNVQRRLDANTGGVERVLCLDAKAFLLRAWSPGGWKWNLRQWLQAASQEPDASFLSRGAASTALCLGLPLFKWVGEPQERYSGLYDLNGHSGNVNSVAFSPDGTSFVSGSDDRLVKIWNTETGAGVSILE